jgi:hypothetical protein
MSSPQTNTVDASEPNLTETDRKFLEMAITCLKTPPEVRSLLPLPRPRSTRHVLTKPPQIDIPKLAEKMNVKPKTISNRWGELRKKLFANGGATGAAAASSASGASPAVTPRKRKAPAVTEGGAKKAPRSTKGKKATQTEVDKVEDNDDEEEDSAIV